MICQTNLKRRFAQQKDSGDKDNRRSAREAHSEFSARASRLRTNSFPWRNRKKTSLHRLRRFSASASFQQFVGHWKEHSCPTVSYVAEFALGNMALNYFFDRVLGDCSYELVRYLSTLENQQGWDAANVEFPGRVNVFIHVQLYDLQLARVVLSDLFHRG